MPPAPARSLTVAETSLADGQLRLAMDLTLRARGHADRAIAIIEGLPDPDRVLAQVERDPELIAVVDAVAGGTLDAYSGVERILARLLRQP